MVRNAAELIQQEQASVPHAWPMSSCVFYPSEDRSHRMTVTHHTVLEFPVLSPQSLDARQAFGDFDWTYTCCTITDEGTGLLRNRRASVAQLFSDHDLPVDDLFALRD